MQFTSPEDLAQKAGALGKGPIAVLLCEDEIEIASSLEHLIKLEFASVLLAVPNGVKAPDKLPDGVHVLQMGVRGEDFTTRAVNAVIKSAPEGAWIGYYYNSEYPFFPFSDHRSVPEVIRFASEERRTSILGFTVDLYAADTNAHPNAVDLKNAHLDADGYFALTRKREGEIMHRQLDFFGGLRWRFEQFVPEGRRRIDRPFLFQTTENLMLRDDHTLTDEELNTYTCPWHNSLTGAICSFRAAKALKSNPSSRDKIDGFMWQNSLPFGWSSQQLLDLGLMEPGQWF